MALKTEYKGSKTYLCPTCKYPVMMEVLDDYIPKFCVSCERDLSKPPTIFQEIWLIFIDGFENPRHFYWAVNPIKGDKDG